MTETKISMLAIDLAKGSFQVCAVGSDGAVLSNRAMSRTRLASLLAEQPVCVVAVEACATSHHWGRIAQAHGHEVRIVPAACAKPFVKRQKNDRVGPITATALVAAAGDQSCFLERAGVRGLAWAGSEAEVERRQGAALRHQQARRSLPADSDDPWCSGSPRQGPWQDGCEKPLDWPVARAAASECRGCRAGQQECEDCLVCACAERTIRSGARHGSRLRPSRRLSTRAVALK